MNTLDEIKKIENAIASQEALRDILPDEQINTAIEALKAQLATYQAIVDGGGASAQGTESTAVGQGGVGVKGNVENAIINTGLVYTIYQSAQGKARLDKNEFQRILHDYLEWVQKAYGKARLYGLESMQTVGEKPKRQLADVFVPLSLQRFTPPRRAEVEELALEFQGEVFAKQKAFLQLVERQRKDGDAIHLNKLLTLKNRLAVIGGAGSGKTTLLAYLAAALASQLRDGENLPVALPKQHKTLVPIIVPLRYRREYLRLSAEVPEQVLTRAHSGTLAGFILWYLMKRSQAIRVADETLAEDFFDRLLRGGGCLVMLDGLDEVVSSQARGQVRSEVERLAEEIYPDNLFLVTARESGYSENAIFSEDFTRLDVLPLEDKLIHALVENWCQQLYPEQIETQTSEITSAIRAINARYERQKLPPLISTPLLTTMVISVKWGEAELPRERARLYEAVIKVILQAQYLDDDSTRQELINWGGPWEEQRDWLSYLALEMQCGGEASAVVDEAGLREILQQRLDPKNLSQFIIAVRSRGGVLEEKAGLFQFVHLTFQEFLAARLLAKERDASLPNLPQYVDDTWWREVLLLLYGFAKVDYAPFAEKYLDWLSELLPELKLAGLEMAGAAAMEIERPDPKLRARQGERLAAALENNDLPAQPKLRALAGDTLAALGDPRFDPQNWHLPADPTMGFIHIPAGPFTMGSDPQKDKDAQDDEQPQHDVALPEYWMAKYPVTVAQWRTFIEAAEYDAFDKDALRDPENRPALWMTWYNAMDYCEWLQNELTAVSSQRLVVSEAEGSINAGLSEHNRHFWQGLAEGKLKVSLPSEAEWEKASRGPLPSRAGGGGRVYPWGDKFSSDFANTIESGIGTTSTVGCFPDGASPYGILDMGGNVWEWTRTIWEPDKFSYPYRVDDGREELSEKTRQAPRVLRGGSYINYRWFARCARRFWYDPDYGSNYRGFRVVVSPCEA